MSINRQEKIQANALEIGMFVAELDRPWLGTPFLLEGVLIEEQAQINTLTSLCTFVYIDRSLSIGEHQKEISVNVPLQTISNVGNNGVSISSHAQVKVIEHHAAQEKFSFFDVLKEIKQSQKSNSQANLKNIKALGPAINSAYQNSIDSSIDDEKSLSDHIKQDVTGIFASLKNWKGTENLSKDKANVLAEHLAKKQSNQSKEINPVEKEIVQVYPTFEKTHIATREVFEALAHDKHIDLTNVHEAVDGMVESIERNPDALMWLAKLKQSDNDAYNHAMNVSITMMAMANFMSLPKKQVKDIGMAGLLQDIGKAKINDALLHKTGKITVEDYESLKKHVDYAIDLLKVTENIPKNVLTTVSQHHERMDGSGYPFNLIGKQISLTGQVAGLIDTYCALTTDRVYAKGIYNQQALEVIHKLRGSKFNGILIDQLVQFLGMYPVTSLVELNTGEVGVVIEQNSVRRLLPRVLILLNPDKTKNTFPTTINLMQAPLTPNGEAYSIVKGLPPDSYGLNPNNFYA